MVNRIKSDDSGYAPKQGNNEQQGGEKRLRLPTPMLSVRAASGGPAHWQLSLKCRLPRSTPAQTSSRTPIASGGPDPSPGSAAARDPELPERPPQPTALRVPGSPQ